MLTPSEILAKIALGEDSTLELKEVRFTVGGKVSDPRRDDLADELAAFANSRGGLLLLGVADNRDLIGIPLDRLDAAEAFVREICQDSIKPPLVPSIKKLRLPNAQGQGGMHPCD